MSSEYHVGVNKIDDTYNDYEGSRGSGPVSLELDSYGHIRDLAVGAFGEGSEDRGYLHQLCSCVCIRMRMVTSADPNRYVDMRRCEMSDEVTRAFRHIQLYIQSGTRDCLITPHISDTLYAFPALYGATED